MLTVGSVAGQVFVLQLTVVVLLVAAAVVALVLQARRDSTGEASRRSLAVAEAFAHAPGTAAAMSSRDPTAVLQPRTEEIRKAADVDAVVVFNREGIRYTHPDPGLIGKPVLGKVRPDERYTETFDTARGRSVISTVPVFGTDGRAIGQVGVAITVEQVNAMVNRQLPIVLASAAVVLALSAGSSALISRRLRRQTHGLGPVEMTRMYDHHDAVLHAVREGVLITAGEGRLLLANDEARRLLDLPAEAEGRDIAELGLDPDIAGLLASGRVVTDEVHRAGDRLLAVSIRSTDSGGGPPGSVATLRDTTELRALAGRAEVARERLQLLYDAGMRIGTTLDVTRTAEELAEVAVPRLADFATVDLLERVLQGEEPDVTPPGAMLVFRRTAQRSVLPGCPEAVMPIGRTHSYRADSPTDQALATGRASRHPVDAAVLRWWSAGAPERADSIRAHGIHSIMVVPLRARGVNLGLVVFFRHRTADTFGEEDQLLAEELAARAAVCIDNARRYTREHTMAVTLQRHLLPRGLPEQIALEVAYRYLPAQAGVGGDWFDVLPLPGARVALVVGDVVGHGLHAAATMGRLRTAVHNFSALDLPPDELLAHLDELVTRIDQDEDTEEERAGSEITGATCLYAIYDPVLGRCTVARAGHVGPALVHPDGAVLFPEVPLSPPLGLGGSLPFETAELQLAEGSELVLFTDGLIEDGDVDARLNLLHDVLAGAVGREPEEICQAVVDAMVPARPRDDVALIVARTRLLDPTQVAEWEVPSDPAAVARVRGECAERLEAWGLEGVQFSTELILSELITNAIRYGTQPIRVRLLRNQTLICEVFDGSSTSPHLRRANTTDEGGRGLFLVAQFAQRWGTRYTPRGKIIWAEQLLHDAATEPSGRPEDILEQWSDEAL
ncbi:SpoIIE family protein phosphatase [Streptomyces griseicoloratus]|nr:SpoIIE family protein phosphatase [Streptomyces griseicoloratus]